MARDTFVVFGSTNVDLFIGGIDRLPGLGREEFAADNLAWCSEPLRMVIGGNGANSAYILGRLGASVRLASAIGEDLLGNVVYDWLKAAGVDQSWLRRRNNAGTATTTIISETAGGGAGNLKEGGVRRRLSFHHPGAYATYSLDDLAPHWEEAAAAVLVTGYPLLHGLRPQGAETVLATAHAAGALTALDIGPAIGKPLTLAELSPLLPHLDILLANEYELDLLGGSIRSLLALGAKSVVVHQGAGGATWYSGEFQVREDAVPCAVQQTVGAGDTFNAGLLYALHQGLETQSALAFANQAAAQVVSSAEGVLGYGG
jgi:sugar/nucleoside kinase (ribokinase family)